MLLFNLFASIAFIYVSGELFGINFFFLISSLENRNENDTSLYASLGMQKNK